MLNILGYSADREDGYFSVATQRESDVRLKKNIKNTKVVALDIIDNINMILKEKHEKIL